VDIARDKTADVGDEALLLARVAPTFVAHDRQKGARAIEKAGIADVIIMDDGFQNPSLKKSLSVIAVDSAVGLGNGYIFPAGPLRAPLKAQMRRADVIVMAGEGAELALPKTTAKNGRAHDVPVLHAKFQPAGDIDWLKVASVVAFCGIGRPDKFFRTLEEAGAAVKAAVPYPDHHAFTAEEATSLLETASREGAILVTTEKDMARLEGTEGPLSELKAKTRALPVSLHLDGDSQAKLTSLLLQALA
jgi:tetraacyldisaccharide 4'-kinase